MGGIRVRFEKGVLTSFSVGFSTMSNSVYSEINFHITWHTKNNSPVLVGRVEDRLHHYLTHKIVETPGAVLHAVGGVDDHIHIAVSL